MVAAQPRKPPTALRARARCGCYTTQLTLRVFPPCFRLRTSSPKGPTSSHLDGVRMTPFPPQSEKTSLNYYLNQAFDTFASTLEDDEFSFPMEERKAALRKARNAWTAWLDARKKVSDLLSGDAKEAYDLGTAQICRHQFVTLNKEFWVLKNNQAMGSY